MTAIHVSFVNYCLRSSRVASSTSTCIVGRRLDCVVGVLFINISNADLLHTHKRTPCACVCVKKYNKVTYLFVLAMME